MLLLAEPGVGEVRALILMFLSPGAGRLGILIRHPLTRGAPVPRIRRCGRGLEGEGESWGHVVDEMLIVFSGLG